MLVYVLFCGNCGLMKFLSRISKSSSSTTQSSSASVASTTKTNSAIKRSESASGLVFVVAMGLAIVAVVG